jgi:hypothetical protein
MKQRIRYSQVPTSEDATLDNPSAQCARSSWAGIVTATTAILILALLSTTIGLAATWGVHVQNDWQKMQNILSRAEDVLGKVEHMLPDKADVEHVVHEVAQGFEHVAHDFHNLTTLSGLTSALSAIVKSAVGDKPSVHPP